VVGNCLAHVQANEAGVVGSDEVESVHQMRVGVRRLRSALRLFEDVHPCPAALDAEIKWLADALGTARDWEVLATATLARLGDAPGLPKLEEAVKRSAAAQRGTAAEAVQSRRYARLLLALGQWMQGAREASSSTPEAAGTGATTASPAADATDTPLRDFAAATLKRLHRRLLRRATALDRKSAESSHALRKFARRVRYATEFFASYQRHDETRGYVKLLTGLQDELGRRNDAAVAGRLLAALAHEDARIRGAAMYAAGFLACGARLRPDRLERRLKRLAQTRRPRSAG
jgi:CHAD domain-containing protein